MKLRYILLLIAVAGALASCKKDSNYPIIGKWQQVKLHVYAQSYQGVISNDTTYTASFGSANYAQFNDDKTCVIGIIFPPGYYAAANYISSEKYNYAQVAGKYVLTSQTTLINPGGFAEADTASINNNTMLIHRVFDSHANYTISDAYYTR